jgi:cytochrome c-type protein NapC
MAQRQHAKALTEGKTCIDCHQGIAHNLPEEPAEPAAAPAAEPAGETAPAPAPTT